MNSNQSKTLKITTNTSCGTSAIPVLAATETTTSTSTTETDMDNTHILHSPNKIIHGNVDESEDMKKAAQDEADDRNEMQQQDGHRQQQHQQQQQHQSCSPSHMESSFDDYTDADR
mmetsp:Transcript_20039/g.24695  ORF Transcript_20039/g.24695 Transcript_20039/m.24695 type:complete len:116 (+) Transcript_20039:91-438(+)